MATRSENFEVIIGNLTRDTKLRYIGDGNALVSFGVATNREWTDSNGMHHEGTQYHEVIAWNRLAEICDEFLQKSSKVYIKGRLQTRTWEDEKTGDRRYRTEIVASDMIVLGGEAHSVNSEKTAREGQDLEEGLELEDSEIEEEA